MMSSMANVTTKSWANLCMEHSDPELESIHAMSAVPADMIRSMENMDAVFAVVLHPRHFILICLTASTMTHSPTTIAADLDSRVPAMPMRPSSGILSPENRSVMATLNSRTSASAAISHRKCSFLSLPGGGNPNFPGSPFARVLPEEPHESVCAPSDDFGGDECGQRMRNEFGSGNEGKQLGPVHSEKIAYDIDDDDACRYQLHLHMQPYAD